MIVLEDLRSTHGTFVQGRRLDVGEEYTCRNGISITFGQKVTSGASKFTDVIGGRSFCTSNELHGHQHIEHFYFV